MKKIYEKAAAAKRELLSAVTAAPVKPVSGARPPFNPT